MELARPQPSASPCSREWTPPRTRFKVQGLLEAPPSVRKGQQGYQGSREYMVKRVLACFVRRSHVACAHPRAGPSDSASVQGPRQASQGRGHGFYRRHSPQGRHHALVPASSYRRRNPRPHCGLGQQGRSQAKELPDTSHGRGGCHSQPARRNLDVCPSQGLGAVPCDLAHPRALLACADRRTSSCHQSSSQS